MMASNSPLNSNTPDSNTEKGQLAAQGQNPRFDRRWDLCTESDAESGSGLRNQWSFASFCSFCSVSEETHQSGSSYLRRLDVSRSDVGHRGADTVVRLFARPEALRLSPQIAPELP
jgi:hypothetical protein